jgi:hypothetical protein
MTEVVYPLADGEELRVDLRTPYLAAALAWLWPGAGHIYQRRYAKGVMFMVCILGTYFFGLGLGQGRVVYASWKPGDYRWQYLFQLQTGLPALPALVQSFKTAGGGDPFLVLGERYPEDFGVADATAAGERFPTRLRFHLITPETKIDGYQGRTLKDGLMAPPAGPVIEDGNDVLGQWHYELKHLFDYGTYFTVIAGLLNLLVIYDAFVGPAIFPPPKEEKKET